MSDCTNYGFYSLLIFILFYRSFEFKSNLKNDIFFNFYFFLFILSSGEYILLQFLLILNLYPILRILYSFVVSTRINFISSLTDNTLLQFLPILNLYPLLRIIYSFTVSTHFEFISSLADNVLFYSFCPS